MSRNFLFVLLSLTVPGLLWGAQGDSPDGAAVDNADKSPTEVTVVKSTSTPVTSGMMRVPYVVLRTAVRSASRVPLSLWRALAWLPRYAAASLANSLARLMLGFREYATDALGYLARSERTELARVRRGSPAPAAAPGSKPTRRGFNLGSLILRLFAYPAKVAFKTSYGLLRFSPIAGMPSLFKSALASGGAILRTPLAVRMGNATRAVADYALAKAWNFTKSSVLPRLDVLANNLKDSGTMPESLMAVIIELQMLYHIFKFLGMA